MKKGLLIWNVIVTVIALVLLFSACTSDSRVDWCVNQISAQAATIQQLQSEVNTLKSTESQLLLYAQTHEGKITDLQNLLNQVVNQLYSQ